VLIIRQTKFAKDRQVPFGPNMGARLSRYLTEHFGSSAPDAEQPLFSFTQGRAVNPDTISLAFATAQTGVGESSRGGRAAAA
jgi:hypothetical protein